MQAATTSVERSTAVCVCVTANLEFYLSKEGERERQREIKNKYVFQKGICAAAAADDHYYYIFIPDKICFDWLRLLLCQFRVTVFFSSNSNTLRLAAGSLNLNVRASRSSSSIRWRSNITVFSNLCHLAHRWLRGAFDAILIRQRRASQKWRWSSSI